MYYIGIDLGTSAAKLLLTDEAGAVLGSVSKPYPLDLPRPGWSQQNPADWQKAVLSGLYALTRDCDRTQIAGIGCSGQMHGLVLLDAEDRVIRPAILWNDGRPAEEVAFLNAGEGRERLRRQTGNIAFAGLTAPKLLWVKKHEPEHFARIRKILLPKDYIHFLLTGEYTTDYSDASGTLLLDVANKRWSPEMLSLCGIAEEQLPHLRESYAPSGTLRAELASELDFPPNVCVCAGAGDNAAAAVGTGTVGAGGCSLSLGTSGTVFISSTRFCMDEANALHAFAHADGGFHLLGCMLSAASCSKWLLERILKTEDYAREQACIAPERLGRNPVFFLPYLMGERSPINDTDARGTLIGMTLDTTRADLVQAVLEGVAFALRDSVEVARHLGIPLRTARLCGGGARSALGRTILANVLNMELTTLAVEEGAALGAAMLAMVACGAYPTVHSACEAIVRTADTVYPEPALTRRYEERYQRFCAIYPACRTLFPLLTQPSP